MPYLSVLIRTYNNQASIENCLQAIRSSSYKDYELIIVDCASSDATASIASRYTDNVFRLNAGTDRVDAQNTGFKKAKGDVMVNIDSDILVRPDSLSIIYDYFTHHPNIDALTGMLSKEHPNKNFLSQYKNLYMYYIFKKMPDKDIDFLYGSIYAVTRDAAKLYDTNVKIAEDTAYGQALASNGKRIVLLKSLEVVHLKKHGFFSFVKNDFRIPFDWAQIFVKFKGWKRVGKNGEGFAHSPIEQLASVLLAPLICFLAGVAFFGHFSFWAIAILAAIWYMLNNSFFLFLVREKGLIFGIRAIFVTFLDHVIMASGIFFGLFAQRR